MRGKLIAQILSIAEPSATTINLSADDLAVVAPLLLNSGGGAMGWWQIRHSSLSDTPVAHELHQAYRLHTLQAAVKEMEISQVFAYLRSQGLEPLLGKGWAIARQYPEPGLRPYGDIDLYVRPEEYADYVAVLKNPGARGWNIDLHRGAAELDDRDFADLYARSQLLELHGTEVRIFGPEDLLRLLCLHFLKEGALRPLWLCDIAVGINSLGENFEWAYFLRGNIRRTEWVLCTLELAHTLLGAGVNGLPSEARVTRLPHWLIPEVLAQWGTGKVTKGRRVPLASQLRNPVRLLQSLWERWPNAIEATVGMKGSFNNWPRLPYQLGECVRRTAGFTRQALKPSDDPVM